MKRIPLTKGKEALVDDQDYEYLIQWKWHTKGPTDGGVYHAVRKSKPDGEGKKHPIYIHREIANLIGLSTETYIDHRNTNGLDNRRDNLRQATHRTNLMNRGPQVNNTSGFKGVTLFRGIRWRAQIGVEGKNYYLGLFDDKVEAARAYNAAAKKHFGEFAWLNPIPGE